MHEKEEEKRKKKEKGKEEEESGVSECVAESEGENYLLSSNHKPTRGSGWDFLILNAHTFYKLW